MRTMQSSQQPRYRSVKYRLSRQSSFKQDDMFAQQKTYLPLTVRTSARKERFISHKSTFANTLNKSHVLNCQNPEQQKMRKTTYMDSFHLILSMQRNRYNAKQKTQQQETQAQRQKQLGNGQVKLPRVSLPVLNELDSYFTVLDNVNLPISYISDEIQRVKVGIAVQAQNIKKIAVQIKKVGQKYQDQLIEIQKVGIKGFEKLKSMLRANKVYQQQELMKHKSAFQKTRDYLPQYYRTLQLSKERIVELQDIIFKGVPFQLIQREQFNQISNKYF